MKKRVSALCLAMLLMLTLAACGQKQTTAAGDDGGTAQQEQQNDPADLEAVQDALVGNSGDIWIWNDDTQAVAYNFAADGRVVQGTMMGNNSLPQVEGTYEVTEDGIVLTNEEGTSEKVLTYSYENGTLRLFDGDREFTFSPE